MTIFGSIGMVFAIVYNRYIPILVYTYLILRHPVVCHIGIVFATHEISGTCGIVFAYAACHAYRILMPRHLYGTVFATHAHIHIIYDMFLCFWYSFCYAAVSTNSIDSVDSAESIESVESAESAKPARGGSKNATPLTIARNITTHSIPHSNFSNFSPK